VAKNDKQLLCEYEEKSKRLSEKNQALKQELKSKEAGPCADDENMIKKMNLINQQIPLLKEENDRMTSIIEKNNDSLDLWRNLCEELGLKLNKVMGNIDEIDTRLGNLEDSSFKLINENERVSQDLIYFDANQQKKTVNGNYELRAQYLEIESLEKKFKEMELILDEEKKNAFQSEFNTGRISDLTRKIDIILEENESLNDSLRTVIGKDEKYVKREKEYVQNQGILIAEESFLANQIEREVKAYKKLKKSSRAHSKILLARGKYLQ
jgi:hypothetical protein